uniref:Serine/threonine-protein phosphatase PGAM5, mitochondrial n=1 Tax=Acrobeloides nanus TaxID=290746 RepID=A0A914D5G8_9BILA
MKTDNMIDEVAPYPCEPFTPDWNATRREFHEDHPRVEAAFRKHIYRASPEQAHDLNELIVCHGNVIRYFVARSLQLPFESWARFSIANAGFVWIVIRPNGVVILKAFNDLGHLPKAKITGQVYKKN